MTKDLLLMFAYHFPPENAIGAARPFRFYKYLRRLGVECHVITAADVSACPDLDAEHVSDPFVTTPRQGIGWQIERAIRKLVLPGVAGTQWALRAHRAALNFLGAHKDARITVFSTYPPLGTHLAAFWFSRKTGLPWIADFRDPLANNPASGETNWLHNAAYRVLDRLLIPNAACVIANTDASEQSLKLRYPARANRIHLLSNGFDPEETLAPLPVPRRERRVFSHVGELYEGRTITPLLLSLGRLFDAGRLPANEIEIQLVGPVRSTSVPDPAFIAAATEQGWLKLVARQVPKDEAQEIGQTSDGLLLVQPHSRLQVPGKIFEYIQIGRPILAFILPDSPAERILERSGIAYQCAYASDPPEALDEAVSKFFDLDTTPNKPSAWFENEFNVQSHAQKLFQLIQGVHRDR